MKKKIFIVLAFALISILVYFFMTLYPQLAIANGYAAKRMCSCTFLSERTQSSIEDQDLGSGPLALTSCIIDKEAKSVTSKVYGLSPRTAVYREGVGCILLEGEDDYNIHLPRTQKKLSNQRSWPLGTTTQYDSISTFVNMTQLQKAINSNFDPGGKMDSMKTRAIVVIHEGQLIAEKYADGYDKDTKVIGWSMTKSITATLLGMLAQKGAITLDEDHLFPEWTDERKDITLRDMMQMQSGLEWSEEYGSINDVTSMLYTDGDVTIRPKSKLLAHPPGTHWYYSSGTTNLLSNIVRNHLDEHETYLRYPYDSLFYRIGMYDTVMETDEAGNYVGSSYIYATARDWARFGLLYLNEGNWFGDQLIDTSWVQFVSTPNEHSGGIYGGQFWLNAAQRKYPDAPKDMFSCEGFEGQAVYIIPSRDMVVVRLGLAEEPAFDFNKMLKGILEAIDIEPV